ncbi:NAD(P)/FAD-dependent oxidoreductase [Streptomyces sp. NPDC127068]|uniref:NAD(P)/FAD-dependent oxidoreductase n=1 Tax=Streptomyces sp. NPDC127068 TaxID=3347127 RepID=UPI0036646DA7
MTRPRYDTDLVVVGGGPAGLATSVHAARAGLSVTLFERRPGPVDKACGEGLMPAGVRRLHALGVYPPGVPLAGIDYLDLSGRRAHAPFPQGHGLGVRRTDLHTALLAAAQSAGVRCEQARVTGIAQETASVTVLGLRARWLVAADGLHSPMRRQLGMAVRTGRRRRFGLRRHWRIRPWSDRVEVSWGPQAEAYVTPVAADQVGVAFLYRPDKLASVPGPQDAYAMLLDRFPELGRRLETAVPASAVRGAGPLRQVTQQRVSGRILFVGDSAGYEDALTGEGISLALSQARAAAQALIAGDPTQYERQWLPLTRRYRWLTRGLVSATSHTVPRALLVPGCKASPGLFRAVVGQLAQ